MKNNIPLDGTNVNDATSDKDAVSLLIMHNAFVDAFDMDDEEEKTDEQDFGYVDERM